MKLSDLYRAELVNVTTGEVLLVAEGTTRHLALAGLAERTIEQREWLREQFGYFPIEYLGWCFENAVHATEQAVSGPVEIRMGTDAKVWTRSSRSAHQYLKNVATTLTEGAADVLLRCRSAYAGYSHPLDPNKEHECTNPVCGLACTAMAGWARTP